MILSSLCISLTLILLCRDDSFRGQIISEVDICAISRSLVEYQLSSYKAGISLGNRMSNVVADPDKGGYVKLRNFSSYCKSCLCLCVDCES